MTNARLRLTHARAVNGRLACRWRLRARLDSGQIIDYSDVFTIDPPANADLLQVMAAAGRRMRLEARAAFAEFRDEQPGRELTDEERR